MRLAILLCAAGLVLAAAPPAAADGVQGVALQGGAGVTAPALQYGYVALPVPHGTLVERVHRPDGVVDGWRIIRGSFGVATAGAGTGLSADGRRLVLQEVTNDLPPARTRLDVLDAGALRVIERIALPGFYAVDAISPDGRWLYLIHYTSRDLQRYEVRAYDIARHRLLRTPVVDPREPGEKMVGYATARVTSPDGRWEYTLYLRPAGARFVHALDTAHRTAACIDLPDPREGGVSLTLGPGGRTLRFVVDDAVEALVDTRTFRVTRPGPPDAWASLAALAL